MKKRPMLALWASCALAWSLTYVFKSMVSLEKNFTNFTVLGVIIALVSIFVIYRIGVKGLYFLAPILFILFFMRFGLFYQNQETLYLNSEHIREQIREKGAYGRIDKTEFKNDSTYLYIGDAVYSEKESAGGVLLLLSGSQEYEPGMYVYFHGEVEELNIPTNPGQFDMRSYYLAKGITFRAIDPYIEIAKENSVFSHALYRIKKLLYASIHLSGGEDAGVYSAMLLGEKGELSDDTKNLYQAGGISHILAISGLHVSIIGAILFGFLRFLRLNKITSTIITSIALIIYSILTGNPVSAIRAAVMLIISLTARLIGRTYDTISAMGFAWCVVCFIYPGQITQAGFQLSFGAIIAFGFVLPPILRLVGYMRKSAIRRKKRKSELIVNRLEEAFLGSLSVAAVTWPIIAWHMYVISPLSILVNIVVIPFMTVIMVNIIIASFIGTAALIGVLPIGAAEACWLPAHYLLKLYYYICKSTTGMKVGQIVTGRPELVQLAVYFVLLALIILTIDAIGKFLEKRKDLYEIGGGEWDKYKKGKKLMLRLVLSPVLLALLIAGLPLLHRPRQEDTFIMLDVGQGDGMIYMSGELCIAVDGGNSFIKGIGSYRIEPALEYYGYSAVDMWFVTHPDTDHCSGLLEMLADDTTAINIESIVIPKTEKKEAWNKLRDAANGNKFAEVIAGDVISWNTGRMTVLYPGVMDRGDANELSLVMRLDMKEKSILLCGDIDLETERRLLDRYRGDPLLDVDVLKVAHHGSKYASSTEFLEAVTPGVAIISVGKNNYGHPSEEALTRLRELNIPIYITQSHGAIKIH